MIPLPQIAESEGERVIREVAQLLDSSEALFPRSGKDSTTLDGMKKSLTPTMSDRFMGMKAALVTNSLGLKSLGATLGFTVLQLDDLTKNNHSVSEPPVDELLKLLGFQGSKAMDTSQFDLVFVHTGVGEKDRIIASDVEYINCLVGGIMKVAHLGSEIGSRLHCSVVMSYGAISKDDNNCSLSLLPLKDENSNGLSVLFPSQSYTVKEGKIRSNVRDYCPMLMAQWQEAVTRKDMAETFSFKCFKECGGNLAIPADRFLHELAFKLWKAPKYGA